MLKLEQSKNIQPTRNPLYGKKCLDELTIPPVCTKTGIFSWDDLNPSETIVSESVSLLVGNTDKELPNSKVASREP